MGNKVVYAWLNAGIPFYIGIGSLRRSKSKRSRNPYCSSKRAKAERENSFEIRILHVNLSWKEACEIEQSLISLYGRVNNKTGILTNMTDGGEGGLGCSPSKETRDKISKSRKGKSFHKKNRKLTEEHKQRIRETSYLKGKKGIDHPRSKPVQTPLGRFESGRLAAKAHGTYPTKISRRAVSEKYPEFFYL